MPFFCDNYPATATCTMKDKYGEFQSMIVLQDQNQFIFDIYVDNIDWNIEKLLWIAFYKNNNNNSDCLLAKLPKDLIRYIVDLIGRSMIDESRSFIKI